MNLAHTFCISASIKWGIDLTVAKYHLQTSRTSAGTTSEEPAEEGWNGIIISAGMMFDFPSDNISIWTSAIISIL